MNAAALKLLYSEADSTAYREGSYLTLGKAAARTVDQHEQLRIDEHGALDRLDRFAEHCNGMARAALLLRESVARSLARARDVDADLTPGVGTN